MLTSPKLRRGYDDATAATHTSPTTSAVVGSLKPNVGSNSTRDKYQRAMVWVLCLGMIGVVAWAGSSCLPQNDDQRPVTGAEAKRLAKMPHQNLRADPVEMKAQLPKGAGGGTLRGQIDWSTPRVHAAHSPSGSSRPDELLQSVPGLVATHDGKVSGDSDKVPRDGWDVRGVRQQAASDKKQRPHAITDVALSAIMSLRADKSADASQLADKASWVKKGAIDGATVDVFRAPLTFPSKKDSSKSSAASKSPEAIFWVDRDAQLRRVQFDPSSAGTTTVDFLYAKGKADMPAPVDVLGGSPIDPRDVKAGEADTLANLRHTNASRSAKIDMTVPVADGKTIRARGYVNWSAPMMHLSVDSPGKRHDGQLMVLVSGTATRTGKAEEMPPSDPPEDGWKTETWKKRVGKEKPGDFDAFLLRLLSMTATAPDDVEKVQKDASWLRKDTLGESKTGVFEYPVPGDAKETKPGQAAFRYWLDTNDDSLRRLEMRTRELGMAHADLSSYQPPTLHVPETVINGLSQ